MLDVHKGGGRRAGCVVVKEMTVSSASGVESVGVRNRCLWTWSLTPKVESRIWQNDEDSAALPVPGYRPR